MYCVVEERELGCEILIPVISTVWMVLLFLSSSRILSTVWLSIFSFVFVGPASTWQWWQVWSLCVSVILSVSLTLCNVSRKGRGGERYATWLQSLPTFTWRVWVASRFRGPAAPVGSSATQLCLSRISGNVGTLPRRQTSSKIYLQCRFITWCDVNQKTDNLPERVRFFSVVLLRLRFQARMQKVYPLGSFWIMTEHHFAE